MRRSRVLQVEIEGRSLSAAATKDVEKGLTDIDDALGPDAYWRAPTWKRVAVIFAGPLANLLLAVVLFTGLFMTSGGRATTTVDSVRAGSPAAQMGLRLGRQDRLDRRLSRRGRSHLRAIGASDGAPVTVVVQRNGETVALGPRPPRR